MTSKVFQNNIDVIAVITLALLCIFTFSNSLQNDFLMDDYSMLLENKNRSEASFLWLDSKSPQSQAYFRPVTHYFNFITFSFFRDNPIGYHVVNLVFVFLSALTLYILCHLILSNKFSAFLCSVFFILHPINGYLINYKNATGYSFMILSMHLSLINFLIADVDSSLKGKYVLSFIWFILALLCHEVIIMYPLYLLAILICIKKYNLLTSLKKCLPSIVTIIGYLALRMKYASLKTSVLDHLALFQVNFLEFAASYTKLIAWYLSKLIFLDGIVLAYNTPIVKVNFFGWMAFLFFLAGLIVYLTTRIFKRGEESLALAWMFIGFLPVALACFSRPLLGFVLQPHWLPFTSVGYFMFIAVLLNKLKSAKWSLVWILTAGILCTSYLLNTRQYNYLWGSQKRYCHYWLTISPNNYWPNFWLGYSYLEDKNFEQAKKYFHRTIKAGVKTYQVLGNLGYIEYQQRNYPQALEFFFESLRLNPRHADTLYYIGDIYLTMNTVEEAEEYFVKAVRLDPYFLSPLMKLSSLYTSQGRLREAQEINERIYKLDPDNPQVFD